MARCDLLVRRVILLNPIFVIPAGDIFDPVLIVEIPLDGFADAGFKGLGASPANQPIGLHPNPGGGRSPARFQPVRS